MKGAQQFTKQHKKITATICIRMHSHNTGINKECGSGGGLTQYPAFSRRD